MLSKPCCYSLLSSSLVSHIVLTQMSHNEVAHWRRRALFKFRRVSHLVMIGCQFESCSSSAFCHLVLTVFVVKQCNQPNCCDRCGHKEVAHCWRRAIFKMTLCYSNNKVTVLWQGVILMLSPSHLDVMTSEGKRCSSSSVSHLFLTASQGEKCSSSSVGHLI